MWAQEAIYKLRMGYEPYASTLLVYQIHGVASQMRGGSEKVRACYLDSRWGLSNIRVGPTKGTISSGC